MVNNKKIIFLLPVWGGGGGERVASDLSFNLPDFIEKIIVAFESKNYYPYKGKLISLHLPLSTKPMLKLFNFLHLVDELNRQLDSFSGGYSCHTT